MVINVAFTAPSGNFVVAEGGGNREVLANRPGIGPWETFKLFNRSRDDGTIFSGDTVALQAFNGRFLCRNDSNAQLRADQPWIDAFSLFTLRRATGSGQIRSGDEVRLVTTRHGFVHTTPDAQVFTNGTDGPSATMRITQLLHRLIHLRSATGLYVGAEGGGGDHATAGRSSIGPWVTFTAVNLSRGDNIFRTGDVLALQAWNGNYLRVTSGTACDVRANAATADAQFVLQMLEGDSVHHGARVALRSVRNGLRLADRGGLLSVDGRDGEDATAFTWEWADAMPFEFAQDGRDLAERPLREITPVTGVRQVLVLHIWNDARPPLTQTAEDIASTVFGPAPTMASWLRAMSGGRFQIASAGVFGPLHTPDETDTGLLLTLAEAAGAPLRRFTTPEGLIDNNRLSILKLGTVLDGRRGAQTYPTAGTSASGIRFEGRIMGVGVDPSLAEPDRMVICHEFSHLVDVPDRYGDRSPLRGDVTASVSSAGERETFVVERVRGSGTLLGGGHDIRVRAYDGSYVWHAPEPPHFLNIGATADGASAFMLGNISGGTLRDGANISLSWGLVRHMLTAKYGGNTPVTADSATTGNWQTFHLRKRGGSAGDTFMPGDSVALQTQDGFFIRADAGSRSLSPDPSSVRRGYGWGVGVGQGASFDNASFNYEAVFLSLYDRMRMGWVRPRFITPDNRGCFLMRPFSVGREALILFDQHNPGQWYTVENRQYTENVDEVISSGIVISWNCDAEGYWQWWLRHANDDWPSWAHWVFHPSVISGAAPTVPPNILAQPLVLDSNLVHRRHHPRAAFTDQEVVLPLGDGDPSRFHLSFHPRPGGAVALCVH